ncbi:MAG: HD-GYP domain-containing protein [Candidatus Aminicenantes bacterium]|nr:HD-GYP domain-containing protein [Candidatus Aminicenantes bacterium]
MKDDRAKKLIVEEKKKSRNNSYPDSQNLDITKIKIFDLNWLKDNLDIQGWGKTASALMSSPTSSPYVLPKIEAFLRASRILDRLENATRQEEYLKVSGLKKLFLEKGFFNSELIYFLAATDSSEESLGHSRFVAAYTLLLAQHSGISNRRVLIDIERGALLHDIGKIGIPERILQKKEPLSDKEMEIIKYHPLIGFAMIKEFSFLQEAAEIVLFHHERYDGSGYPFGLQGEEIPISARLFSLSDTLDAITSDRPYRRGRSLEEALAEIEKCSGSQFDPRLVEIMLAIPAEKWQKTKEKVLKSLRQPAIH